MRKTFQQKINGQELKVTVGGLSVQAESSALVQYGETMVLVTVCSAPGREGSDFFPLTVDYEEKYYAAGEILGSRYLRREGRPSDEAILTARLIDRAIRPLFPEGFRREVQIIVTVLSFDGENDPTFPALFGASLTLSLSSLPWNHPLGIANLAQVEGGWKAFPSYEEKEKAEAELTVTAVKEKDQWLLNMMEAGAQEIEEKEVLEGLAQAEKLFQATLEFQETIIKENSQTKIEPEIPQPSSELEKGVVNFVNQEAEKHLFGYQGLEAKAKQAAFQEKFNQWVEENYPEERGIALAFLAVKIRELVHKKAAEGKRLDSRKMEEIRPLEAEVSLSPRAHGSGLFSRGLTKVLTILTLGSPGDTRKIEGMEVVEEKRFMHQYNFPPFSNGEVAPLRGPKRREIGHGYLAEKALIPVLPKFEDFPYTIRLVSEVLSSNGSTSMASVCASSLALMDGGVPISSPVAGISVGLMKNGENYQLLTDIQGWEDKEGDMDFKVAGTRKGITAIQLDVKIDGLPRSVAENVLTEAKKSRFQILDLLQKTISQPRDHLSVYAPKIMSGQIDPKRLGFIIGPGGKNIKHLSEKYQALIDLEDSGQFFVTAQDEENARAATEEILILGKEIKPGDIFQGKVTRLTNFGAFVEIRPGQEGLVHISQFIPQHLDKVEDVVKLGEIIPVKLMEIDEEGRYNLSAQAAGFKPSIKKHGPRRL